MKRYVSFDWAVKKLLRSKANFGILEGFLSELLCRDIKILQLLESEANKDNIFDKFNRVDLLVEEKNGSLIIIEIQNNSQLDYLQRMLYGTSKLLIENIIEGSPYALIKKIISVNIVYFDLGQGDDYIYQGSTNFIGLNKRDELKLNARQSEVFKVGNIYEIYPEYYIIKVNKFDDIAKNTLDEWIYFLKNEEIKENFHAKGLLDAQKKLDIMKLPKLEQEKYKRYKENLMYEASMELSTYGVGKIDGEKIGIKKGEKIGIEKGEKNKASETAKKMLNDKFNTEAIMKYTGLTIEEISSLCR